MTLLNNLVVGVDGSEGSSRAFRWAVTQANDGQVLAVHGFSPAVELAIAAVQINLDPARAEYRRLLDEDWAATSQGAAHIETSFVDDYPANALAQASQDRHDATIVIGHQDHQRWGGGHVGDIASWLLHNVRVPIVMTTKETKPAPLSGTIVIGIHGPTALSHPPLTWAVGLASERSLPLHLVSVTEPLIYPGYGYPDGSFAWDFADLHTANADATDELKAEIQATYPGLDITAETLQGHPTTVLQEAITKQDAGLVVIGNHHHTKLSSILTDAVSRHLPAMVPCPVVAVPAE